MMKHILVLLLSVLTLVSCVTATGPVFNEMKFNEKDSIVYIYRESSIVGGALSVDLYVNGEYLISLDNDGYYPVRVKPGDFKINAEAGIVSKEITINAHPGRKYYIRTGGLAGYDGELLLINMETKIGSKQIVDNRLQEKE